MRDSGGEPADRCKPFAVAQFFFEIQTVFGFAFGRASLLRQIVRHSIEFRCQLREFVAVFFDPDAVRQIAFADRPRTFEQSRNRARKAAAQHNIDDEKNRRQQEQGGRKQVDSRPRDVIFNQGERLDDFD